MAGGLAVRLALVLVLSVIPLVWPAGDEPTRADAVIILSGDHGERLAQALPLIDKGIAPTLVFDGTPDRAEEDVLCRTRQAVEYICLRPQPDSTRDEARAAGRLAASRGWRRVIVVTSDFHATRSRMLFRRCIGGSLQVVAAHPTYEGRDRLSEIVTEWFKVAYTVTLARGC